MYLWDIVYFEEEFDRHRVLFRWGAQNEIFIHLICCIGMGPVPGLVQDFIEIRNILFSARPCQPLPDLSIQWFPEANAQNSNHLNMAEAKYFSLKMFLCFMFPVQRTYFQKLECHNPALSDRRTDCSRVLQNVPFWTGRFCKSLICIYSGLFLDKSYFMHILEDQLAFVIAHIHLNYMPII